MKRFLAAIAILILQGCGSLQIVTEQSEQESFTGNNFVSVATQSYPGTMNSRGTPAPVGNDPPVWSSTPTPSFTEDVPASYDLLQDVADPEGDTLTFVEEAGCTYPSDATLNDSTKKIDYSTGTAASVSDCILSADDGTNAPVDSPAFTVQIVAVGDADFTICASGCDFNNIADAALVANPGEIFEVQADSPGGSKTYTETVVWSSGTAGNYITFRGRAADTITITENSTSRNTINANGVSWHKWQHFNLNEDSTYDAEDGFSNLVDRTIEATGGAHHLIFDDITGFGGNGYTCFVFRNSVHHIYIKDSDFSKCGNNNQSITGGDTGDLYANFGDDVWVIRTAFSLGGHQIVSMHGNFSLFEHNTVECGTWAAHHGDATYPGTRCAVFHPGWTKGAVTSPYGYETVRSNVFKNAGPSKEDNVVHPNPTVKVSGVRLNVYGNLFHTNEGESAAQGLYVFNFNHPANVGPAYGEQNRFSHNVIYNGDRLIQFKDSNDLNSASGIHTAGNGASSLTTTGKSWTSNDLVDMTITNITDGSTATITANGSNSVTGSLSGGTDDDWDTNDDFVIHDLAFGIDNQFKNNIVDAMKHENSTQTIEIRMDATQNQHPSETVVDNSLMDILFDGNIFNSSPSGTWNLINEGGANASSVASAESTYNVLPNFQNNRQDQTMDYVNIAAQTLAGAVLDGSSGGRGVAVTLTTMVGSGASATTGTLADTKWFYHPQATISGGTGYDIDSADFEGDVPLADCIKIGSNSAKRLTALDIETGVITWSGAISWSGGDTVFRVLHTDCTTLMDDIGLKN